MGKMKRIRRKDNEPPYVTAALGWRYHHLGIPTSEPRAGETHVPHLGIHVRGFESSPFGVQWMRFEGDSQPAAVHRLPHVAFEVDDLEQALRECGAELLTPPNSPSPGVRVAMIIHDGAPIELIEFRKKGKKKGR